MNLDPKTHEYLSFIGKKGGEKSRRILTHEDSMAMNAIKDKKRQEREKNRVLYLDPGKGFVEK